MFGSGVLKWRVLSVECTVSIDFFYCFEGTLQCLDALKGTQEKARALEGAAAALMSESLGYGPLCACNNCKYVLLYVFSSWYQFIVSNYSRFLVVFINPKTSCGGSCKY